MADVKNYDEPIITVKFSNHKFRFYLVPTNATIEFAVDGDDKKNKIKEIVNNRIYFKETLEIFIGNDVEFVDYVTLTDENFAILKSEQNILNAKLKAERDKVREWSLDKKTKKDLFSMIDKHTKKVKYCKVIRNGEKQKEKYVIHNFTIGSEKIRYIERCVDGKVFVNPDYKVRTDFKRAGGIASKEGELLVWKYYYEMEEPSEIDPEKKKGFWETARVMRYSEQICYEIVMRYGEFSNKQTEKKKRGFFRKKAS